MNDKINIIIPTIMQSDINIFTYTLKELAKNRRVRRIIIIDNTYDQTCKLNNLSYKIHIINGADKKYYVNQAWNLGISMSSSEYYCLLNDDVLMHSNLIDEAFSVLDDKNISLLTVKTMNNVNINEFDSDYASNVPATYTTDIPNFNRQGWIMFGRTKDWINIPPELKIFYGDDFIYREARKNGSVVMIDNHVVSHFQSSSMNNATPEIVHTIQQDDAHWIELNK